MKILLKVFIDFLLQSNFKIGHSYMVIKIGEDLYHIPILYEYNNHCNNVSVKIYQDKNKEVMFLYEELVYGIQAYECNYKLSDSNIKKFIEEVIYSDNGIDLYLKEYLAIKRKEYLNTLIET